MPSTALPARSAELVRNQYVASGSSPTTTRLCARVASESTAEITSLPAERPTLTDPFVGSSVDHSTRAVPSGNGVITGVVNLPDAQTLSAAEMLAAVAISTKSRACAAQTVSVSVRYRLRIAAAGVKRPPIPPT
ncbi:hypothetical protein MLP_48390 [Microlunatus phosphovorus NM-1]|uniref:Uncharacterized protein n=1 Tax=Microlunatus phosphovorus (strain ATCC 700054 / DSM 10555 / JCM 9379 / NBRC 101784 / NCIMB 13414 / VKM Ac-1990 / NM-1) TaxID=1032480 RepID=F5XFB5_MICPN|nr:hypothetical protein MLP_48390 [Microlunatus phosphovorus NM-1]